MLLIATNNLNVGGSERTDFQMVESGLCGPMLGMTAELEGIKGATHERKVLEAVGHGQ